MSITKIMQYKAAVPDW